MFIDAILSKNIPKLQKIYGTLDKSGLKGLNNLDVVNIQTLLVSITKNFSLYIDDFQQTK